MLDFQYPVLEDRAWMRPILSESGGMGNEYAFGTLFLWGGVYGSRYCRFEDFLLLNWGKDRVQYNFPIGKGDLKRVLGEMMEDARQRGDAFRMWGMTGSQCEQMEAAFRPRKCALILREGGCGQQRGFGMQHGREPVEHIRRAVAAVDPVRAYVFRRADRAPRRAAERVGVARAVLDRRVHRLPDLFRDAERVDVRGQVERCAAVGFRIGIHIPAVYIFGHIAPPSHQPNGGQSRISRTIAHSTSASTLAAVIRSIDRRMSPRLISRSGSPNAAFLTVLPK